MEWQEILSVEFERISRSLGIALEGLTAEDLNWQPQPDSNSIGWLTWHLTRWQDVQIASFLKKEQVWMKDGWYRIFGRTADAKDHGKGHKPEDLAKFKSPDTATQLGYHQAVLAQTKDEGCTPLIAGQMPCLAHHPRQYHAQNTGYKEPQRKRGKRRGVNHNDPRRTKGRRPDKGKSQPHQ